MSLEWGFACDQCGEHTETIFNHGDDILRELFNNYDAIVAINAKTNLKVTWMAGQPYFDEFLDFVAKHRQHGMYLVDEYGQPAPIGEHF